jgi:hypothetical protein
MRLEIFMQRLGLLSLSPGASLAKINQDLIEALYRPKVESFRDPLTKGADVRAKTKSKDPALKIAQFYSFAASDSQSFLRKSPTIPHNSGSQRGIRKIGFEYDHAPERTAIASPSGPNRNATQ